MSDRPTTGKPPNGEKLWRERITMFISIAVFVGGVLAFVFVTRGELGVALAAKADKSSCEEHEKATAHREQVIVNQKQAEWNQGQEDAISTLGTGLKRMELLMVEQMVAAGQLDRPTIKRILRKVPE